MHTTYQQRKPSSHERRYYACDDRPWHVMSICTPRIHVASLPKVGGIILQAKYWSLTHHLCYSPKAMIYGTLFFAVTGVYEKNTPREEETGGKTGFQKAKSGAGEQFLPLACMGKAFAQTQTPESRVCGRPPLPPAKPIFKLAESQPDSGRRRRARRTVLTLRTQS